MRGVAGGLGVRISGCLTSWIGSVNARAANALIMKMTSIEWYLIFVSFRSSQKLTSFVHRKSAAAHHKMGACPCMSPTFRFRSM